MNNNKETISPKESLDFKHYQNKKIQKPAEKACPNYTIKNIFFPELFLDKSNLDKFSCSICKNVCDDPVYQHCGCNIFCCKECLLLYYDYNDRKCPECKKRNEKDLINFDTLALEIKTKKMKCINHSKNCNWEGKCEDYKAHLINCSKEIINCPFKGCVIKLKREEMPEHKKKCEYLEIPCEKCKLISLR